MNVITINGKEEAILLAKEEDHFLDFKSVRITPASIQKHFVAFANTDGGELYIGIEDKKAKGDRIIGFKNQEEANSLIQLLLTDTKPSIEGVEIEFIRFGIRGYVLHVTVPKSPQVHYTSANECYIRLNASSNKITGDSITRLAYAKGAYHYEKVAIPDVEVDEIIGSTHLQSYMERVVTNQEPFLFLQRQKLLTKVDDKACPNVASILLFHDEPQASLGTRCAIKVYRLQTTEREYKREHLKEMPTTIEGPVEQQIHQVIKRVNEILSDVRYNIGGKLIKLKYPAEALKEILVNAVIHRDYSINDDIHVRIYDNRIEVQSPGKLPGYITIKNIRDERYSRNPNIVRLLHKLPDPVNHDIGEGLDTVFNSLKKAGLVPPEIIELENAVVLTVEHRRIASLEDIILEYLDEHGTVTNKVIRELSGEDSENKVKKALQKLRERGDIEPIDPNASPFKFEYRKTEKSS